MICIPIMAITNTDALDLLRLAAYEPADMYELRLDRMEEEPDIAALIHAADRPVLATCRSAEQGGWYTGSRENRAAMLQRAIVAGARYIDAEEDVIGDLRSRKGVVVMASWHDFSGTPDNLPDVLRRLSATRCDWVKVAVMANRPADNVAVLNAIQGSPKPAVAVAMGEMGLITRILGPAFGSNMTFGRLSAGMESAPGQTTARELVETYRVREITRRTAVYGLLGDPVKHSTGPQFHNQAYRAAGIDAVYIPFLCRDAADFLDAMPGVINLRGCSVTMPHKEAALAWAGAAAPDAVRIGAANTLTRRADGWYADNTDYVAVVSAVADKAAEAGLPAGAGDALVLGTGGAARAIGAALATLGYRVTVAGRSAEKAQAMAEAMQWKCTPWAERATGRWSVVANATSVGMLPDVTETPYPAAGWRPGMIAFESVYSPRCTRFLREARQAGSVAVGGHEMFVRQAERQFEIWTGLPFPRPGLCGVSLVAGEERA